MLLWQHIIVIDVQTVIFYIISFVAVYAQVFLLVTFFEGRRKIRYQKGSLTLAEYPSITVVIPCWNEGQTVLGTIDSLFNLKYPKEKLSIFIVDDGSTDNTWDVIQQFKDHPMIRIFRKENGGKHTALNHAIDFVTTDLVACLDADSFVDPESLVRMATYFVDDKTMAVAPSISIYKPKNIIQHAQKAEYEMAVFIKKMLGLIGGIHVTPGPFSIYRRKVFDIIGKYRKAHNTEDMEIAYRMQMHHLKIEQCNDAFVYTVAPNTVKKLYKQRLRWIYGFIRNTIDYRGIIARRQYGNFSMFTLPAGLFSIFALIYMTIFMLFQFIISITHEIIKIKTVGFSFHPSFNFFFVNTTGVFFVGLIAYLFLLSALIIGKRMARRQAYLSTDILYFISVFSFIAPVWIFQAVYKTIFNQKTRWR